jgi:hypothetical protein
MSIKKRNCSYGKRNLSYFNPSTGNIPSTTSGNTAGLSEEIFSMYLDLSIHVRCDTTRTGRRNPGPLPTGMPKSAHQTSPRVIFRQFPECFDARIFDFLVSCNFFINPVQLFGNMGMVVLRNIFLQGFRCTSPRGVEPLLPG